MGSGETDIARDLARSLQYVKRAEGIPFIDEDGLWLISRPAPPSEWEESFGELLVAPETAARREWARVLGAQEVKRVSTGWLGRLSYHIKRIDPVRVRELIDDGHRPLRTYRGVDLEGFLEERREEVGYLSELLEAHSTARESDESNMSSSARRFASPRGTRLERMTAGDDVDAEVRRASDRLSRLGYPGRAAVLVEAFSAPQAANEARRSRAEAFLDIVAGAISGDTRNLSQEQREFIERLRGLPDLESPRARAISRVFRDWMGADGAPSRRDLRSAATAGLREGGLQGAAVALVDIWPDDAGRPSSRAPSVPVARAAELFAQNAGIVPRLPEKLDPRRVRSIQRILDATNESHRASAYSLLCDISSERLTRADPEFFAKHPFELVKAVYARGLESNVHTSWSSARLSKFVEFVDGAERAGIPGISLDNAWVQDAFDTELDWAAGLMLALVSDPPDELGADRVDVLPAFAELVRGDHPEFHEALEDWDTPRVESAPPALEELRALMPFSEEDLVHYLHYRRILGEKETFSDAIVEVLEFERKEREQVEYLRGALRDEEMSEPKRAALEGQLEKLTDMAARSGRMESLIRRTRNRLEAGVAELRRASLERVLDRVTVQLATRLLPRVSLPDPLPDGMRTALLLLQKPDVNREFAEALFRDVLEGRSIRQRDENQTWLAAATFSGTSEWLEGFDVEAEINGSPVRIHTESDPLHALRMGSYFDTCLSLGRSGFNAWSALVNVLDVNKHVVYVTRADGTVLARKLIGATSDGKLAGYRTYSHVDWSDTRVAFQRAVAPFAERCGLALSDSATPETLHGDRWYDDGNEPWLNDDTLSILEGAEPSEVASAFVEAVHASDWELLAAIARSDANQSMRAAAGFRIGMAQPSSLNEVPRVHVLAVDYLSHLGRTDWGSHADTIRQWWSYWRAIWEVAPVSADAFDALLKCAEAMEGRPDAREDMQLNALFVPSLLQAQFPFAHLVRYRELVSRAMVDESGPEHAPARPYVERIWEHLLGVALLRDGGAHGVLALLESTSASARRLGLRLATFVDGDEAVDQRLRRMLRDSAGVEREYVAMALGALSGLDASWHLISAFRRETTNLALAAAVVATRDPEAVREAREDWLPPSDVRSQLANPRWVEAARIVRALPLFERLQREVENANAELERVEDPLEVRAATAELRRALLTGLVLFAEEAEPLVETVSSGLSNEVFDGGAQSAAEQSVALFRSLVRREEEFAGAFQRADWRAAAEVFVELDREYSTLAEKLGLPVEFREQRVGRVLYAGLLAGDDVLDALAREMGEHGACQLFVAAGAVGTVDESTRSRILEQLDSSYPIERLHFLRRMAEAGRLETAFDEEKWFTSDDAQMVDRVFLGLVDGDSLDSELAHAFVARANEIGSRPLAYVLDRACHVLPFDLLTGLLRKYGSELPDELDTWPLLEATMSQLGESLRAPT